MKTIILPLFHSSIREIKLKTL